MVPAAMPARKDRGDGRIRSSPEHQKSCQINEHHHVDNESKEIVVSIENRRRYMVVWNTADNKRSQNPGNCQTIDNSIRQGTHARKKRSKPLVQFPPRIGKQSNCDRKRGKQTYQFHSLLHFRPNPLSFHDSSLLHTNP